MYIALARTDRRYSIQFTLSQFAQSINVGLYSHISPPKVYIPRIVPLLRFTWVFCLFVNCI